MAYVKQITIHNTLNKSINYIVDPKKTDDSLLVTGLNCAMNSKLAYKQMLFTKNQFGKTDKVLGYHFVQSFKPNEIKDINLAHEVGVKWAEKLSNGNYQMVVSTHIDKGHIHNHFVMNSVDFRDGKKYDSNKTQLEEIRNISDKICSEYGLSLIEKNPKNRNKSYKEWKEEKKGTSWKSQIKNEINNIIKSDKVKSFEEFVKQLEDKGYEVKYKNLKHIAFKAPGQVRFCRGITLGEDYTEEALRNKIKNINEIKFIKYKNKDRAKWVDSDVYRFKYKPGTLGNNIELTALIVKALLGIENNKKMKSLSPKKKEYAVRSLKQLEKALLIMDKNSIKNETQITENIKQIDADNKFIGKYVDEAKLKIKEIMKLESIYVKLEADHELIKKYNSSMVGKVIYQKQIEEYIQNKLILEKNNIINNKDLEKIKEDKNVCIDGIEMCKVKVEQNIMKKDEHLELNDIVDKINNKTYIKYLKEGEIRTLDDILKEVKNNNNEIQGNKVKNKDINR